MHELLHGVHTHEFYLRAQLPLQRLLRPTCQHLHRLQPGVRQHVLAVHAIRVYQVFAPLLPAREGMRGHLSHGNLHCRPQPQAVLAVPQEVPAMHISHPLPKV